MAQCSYCGTTILFGGVQEEGRRFCNANCHAGGQLAAEAERIPAEVVAADVKAVAEGPCPVCGGSGPCDVFTSYRVLSLVVVTTWKSLPRVSCRACATKAQLFGTLYSFVLGWWGIPWGFLMTPVQIVRNLVGLAREANPARPSPLLESMVRLQIAGAASAAARRRAAA